MAVRSNCGVNILTSDGLIGKSVADARVILRQSLNIAPEARSYVNGELVESELDMVLEDGDSLEFIKASGGKGLTQ